MNDIYSELSNNEKNYKDRDQIRELTKLLKKKNIEIKELKEKLRPKKTLEESMKDLIYRFCLVNNSPYFKREVAARIMRAAVNQCKRMDKRWKNIKGSEMEELLILNGKQINI